MKPPTKPPLEAWRLVTRDNPSSFPCLWNNSSRYCRTVFAIGRWKLPMFYVRVLFCLLFIPTHQKNKKDIIITVNGYNYTKNMCACIYILTMHIIRLYMSGILVNKCLIILVNCWRRLHPFPFISHCLIIVYGWKESSPLCGCIHRYGFNLIMLSRYC